MMRVFAQVMVAMSLAVAASFNAQAQTKPKVTTLGPDFPKATLFVGNSFFYYNNGMPGRLSLMERAIDTDKMAYRNTMVTIGGSGLDWHDMDNLLRPGGLGAYSFDDDNNVVFNKPGKQYDTVVMMDCSQCPIHPQLKDAFTIFAKKDSEIVRAHGMRPVLFMSWAYLDKPEMTEGLADAYTTAGNANDALVIPAGLAFARVRKLQPELNLYAPDRRHPSPAGTYLAACVTLAALTGRSPVGNSYTMGIDPETAQLLQKAAWDTVQEYYGR
ncbi:DUF4886 domain-containing protein [Bradyrhizobium sp. BR 10261]|uniref:DUF4886 domain-containing protein n=1 Tax=Bradyrhizobium sp. BR 10261 TaxID=2749992 RepID=UPI001C645D13|nr:DUF4886 domain-containing protein [Bradyrhizobium sp. BR 10261]MBW7967129.1 hypothetical protein [Bradyrhizobium sp. BR 10261]